VVSLVAPLSTSQLETRLGLDLEKVHVLCLRNALLLEMIVAASQVAVSLGYILLCARCSISYSLALLDPTFRSDQAPGLLSISVMCHSRVRVPAAAARASYAAIFLRFLLSTALRFKEKHLLLDYSLCHQLQRSHGLLQNFQAYSPTGSYLSILSGRWVRGRRKVMKKPVRAIDMRRTATVLDFAVGQISSRIFASNEGFGCTFLRHSV
jgi:hypothetical protein